MGRNREPARTWMRKDDERWLILDQGKQIQTGARGRSSKPAADLELERYLASKHFNLPPAPQPLSEVPVDAVLTHYINNLRDDIAAPKRQAYAVKALMRFWTKKVCSEVDANSCKNYCKTRKKLSTARRELGVLRAALSKAHESGIIPVIPQVPLPPKSKKKPAALKRQDVARLLWELRKSKRSRHAAKFLICMFYSGSRPGTVLQTTWEERADGPWVDLDARIWWRSGEEEVETIKRRRSHSLPDRLAFHLNLWRNAMMRRARRGEGQVMTYLIEHPRRPGKPVNDIGRAIESGCQRAGIRRITPHTLKHTAITNAIRSGMSLEDAAEYFSTSARTIEETYWHHSPHHQAEATQIMNKPGIRQ